MKTGTIVTIVIIVLAVVGVYFYYFSTAPSVVSNQILYPKGGETFSAGNSYTLQWSSVNAASTTQIFLIDTSLESQGESVAISDRIYGVPDTGSYVYTVPTTTPSGTYKLEIGSLTSNPFMVAASTI